MRGDVVPISGWPELFERNQPMKKLLMAGVAVIALSVAPASARVGGGGGHGGHVGGVHGGGHVGMMHGGGHFGGRGVGAGVGFGGVSYGAGIGRYGPCLNVWPIIYDPRCYY